MNLEFHRRISKHYGRLDRLESVVGNRIKDADVWRFEARVAEKTVADWLAEEPLIRTYRGISLDESTGAVAAEASKLNAIRLSNGQTVAGRIFVDASYEGDLLAAAGISTTYGRESRAVYGESLAGIRDQTPYRQIDVPLDPYIVPGDPSSGLLYGVSPEPFGTPGDEDKHLQAYSYRLPLTDDPESRVPFAKPEGFDPAWYELHRRYFRAGGSHYSPQKRLPSGKTDLIGSEGALSTDLLGMNDEWPVATQERRHEILEETRKFTMGLMWFFANDPAVPVRLFSPSRACIYLPHAISLTISPSVRTSRINSAPRGPPSATAVTSSRRMAIFRANCMCVMDGAWCRTMRLPSTRPPKAERLRSMTR